MYIYSHIYLSNLYSSHTNTLREIFSYFMVKMTMFSNKIVLSLFLISFLKTSLVADAKQATFLQDFRVTWGDSHIKQLEGGRAIQLILDQNSGMCNYRSNEPTFSR